MLPRRRSSILKTPKSPIRNPLVDLASSPVIRRSYNKRVSFADTHQITEFLVNGSKESSEISDGLVGTTDCLLANLSSPTAFDIFPPNEPPTLGYQSEGSALMTETECVMGYNYIVRATDTASVSNIQGMNHSIYSPEDMSLTFCHGQVEGFESHTFTSNRSKRDISLAVSDKNVSKPESNGTKYLDEPMDISHITNEVEQFLNQDFASKNPEINSDEEEIKSEDMKDISVQLFPENKLIIPQDEFKTNTSIRMTTEQSNVTKKCLSEIEKVEIIEPVLKVLPVKPNKPVVQSGFGKLFSIKPGQRYIESKLKQQTEMFKALGKSDRASIRHKKCADITKMEMEFQDKNIIDKLAKETDVEHQNAADASKIVVEESIDVMRQCDATKENNISLAIEVPADDIKIETRSKTKLKNQLMPLQTALQFRGKMSKQKRRMIQTTNTPNTPQKPDKKRSRVNVSNTPTNAGVSIDVSGDNQTSKRKKEKAFTPQAKKETVVNKLISKRDQLLSPALHNKKTKKTTESKSELKKDDVFKKPENRLQLQELEKGVEGISLMEETGSIARASGNASLEIIDIDHSFKDTENFMSVLESSRKVESKTNCHFDEVSKVDLDVDYIATQLSNSLVVNASNKQSNELCADMQKEVARQLPLSPIQQEKPEILNEKGSTEMNLSDFINHVSSVLELPRKPTEAVMELKSALDTVLESLTFPVSYKTAENSATFTFLGKTITWVIKFSPHGKTRKILTVELKPCAEDCKPELKMAYLMVKSALALEDDFLWSDSLEKLPELVKILDVLSNSAKSFLQDYKAFTVFYPNTLEFHDDHAELKVAFNSIFHVTWFTLNYRINYKDYSAEILKPIYKERVGKKSPEFASSVINASESEIPGPDRYILRCLQAVKLHLRQTSSKFDPQKGFLLPWVY